MPKNEEVSLASLGIQMPYSMQAEQSVLGAALVDETVLNRLITDMEPEMFYSDQNRAIYETMRSLYTESEAVDIVTLVNALASNKTFASADDAKVYLARIAETLPSVSNVDSYFKIVKEKYQGRRLIDAARSILNETASGEDADLLLESAEQKIYDIRSGRDKSGVKTIRESILEVIDTMQKLSGADRDKFAGIPTGFNYLDTVLTGLGRSDPDYSGRPPRYGQDIVCAEHCNKRCPPAEGADDHFQSGNDLRAADGPHSFQHGEHRQPGIPHGPSEQLRLERFCPGHVAALQRSDLHGRFLRHLGAGDQGKNSHDQPGSQEGKNRARYYRLPSADAECQAHREPRAGDQ